MEFLDELIEQLKFILEREEETLKYIDGDIIHCRHHPCRHHPCRYHPCHNYMEQCKMDSKKQNIRIEILKKTIIKAERDNGIKSDKL